MNKIEEVSKDVEKKAINFTEEISNFIFTSRYSRYNEKLKRRETWEEAIDRLQNMHLKKYSFLLKEDIDKIKWSFDLVKQKRIVPSMRSIQFGGKAIEVKNERIYNCAVRHIDSLRSFAEVFFLLLCGNGVGIGLSKYFLDRLPDLVDENDKTGIILTYQIEDKIEGWSDSIETLLNCYFKNTSYTGRKIIFDYSRIRKKGELLKIGGGKAPGYRGLKNCHIKIKKLLDYIIEVKKQNRLKSINAYDILMHCADAVLSGGIRRSATSVIFDKNDEDLINAKIYQKVDHIYSFHFLEEREIGGKKNKYYEGRIKFEGEKIDIIITESELNKLQKENLIFWKHVYPQRARSNNSVLLLRNEINKIEFESIIKKTKEWGEPGFVFANHKWQLLNPCFEINFIPVTNDGICGVQFCNLTSINGRLVDSKDKFKECVEAETIIGTLQAGYTNFPYLSNIAKKLTEEEALLGCSITGMMDNPDILLNKDLQKEMSKFAIEVNKEWSRKLKINQAARICCLKPEGTSSLVLNCASGIHPHHSYRYFRRVQNNKIDNVYKFFKKINPEMCEHSVWSENQTDDIITFPIEVNKKVLIKSNLSALKHLDIIKSTQENWVRNGITEINRKSIEHNVSCTITIKDEEWQDVIDYLFNNKDFFSAVSLISYGSDKEYPQPPNEEIVTENDENLWKKITGNFKHIDYTQLKEEDDNTNLSSEGSCYGGVCELKV